MCSGLLSFGEITDSDHNDSSRDLRPVSRISNSSGGPDVEISGSALKVMAMLVMLIDHIAVGILLYLYSKRRLDLVPFVDDSNIEDVYISLRAIGRTAFPIFAFLLVEGFVHTSSRLRYLISLLTFSLISEPFFDLALNSRYDGTRSGFWDYYFDHKEAFDTDSNIYFTLALGLIIIWCTEFISDRLPDIRQAFALSLIPLAVLSTVAYLIHSDYSFFGTIFIYILYMLRHDRIVQATASYIFLAIAMFEGLELWSFPAFFLMTFYKGKRGFISRRLKYLFYFFYPMHLFLIIAARCALATLI
ncbi:TraX family protein [Butyrivibrio sp. MC2013]|uniref:TraX family protein n=1 Tax=Butyrivibrio sp. MC2013 TaxID=1280686 RepID=UPI00040089C0|nr:TraX family protein [Butyrivibrio sp. MC2013]